jgi:hypothetical protein
MLLRMRSEIYSSQKEISDLMVRSARLRARMQQPRLFSANATSTSMASSFETHRFRDAPQDEVRDIFTASQEEVSVPSW